MSRRLWSADEVRRAIGLYVQIPFGRIDQRNPEIIKLADDIDRTPSAVALKLANLAALDETLPREGMRNASTMDRAIWTEFFQLLMAPIPDESPIVITPGLAEAPPPSYEHLEGLDRYGVAKLRTRQELFRRMVLSAYDNKCALTGIDQPELLIAGHIKPWAHDPSRRLHPTNGICLNRLHDRAFDEGLISFQDDGKLLVSSGMKPSTREKMERLAPTNHLRMPRRFLPDKEMLRYHRDVIFEAKLADA